MGTVLAVAVGLDTIFGLFHSLFQIVGGPARSPSLCARIVAIQNHMQHTPYPLYGERQRLVFQDISRHHVEVQRVQDKSNS